ncbi:MAG: diaminopimelate epimerase [Proteobacteria bacterium]|nr:diaminopimelate epimerase [Pseudomonadota bacterium]
MSKKLHFYKVSGSGNDFIIINNFDDKFEFEFFKKITPFVCNRNNGVGADGLIVLNKYEGLDFRWDFFNSDGTVAEMCGNGSRCAGRLYSMLTGKKEVAFMTLAGVIHAYVKGNLAKIRLSDPVNFIPNVDIYVDGDIIKGHFINTGVPHFVIFFEEGVDDLPVKELGRKIRFHERFSPAGTNVNFVSPIGENVIKVRTYERGVEDETLACGTGASASALIFGYLNKVKSPVEVITTGGEKLYIYFSWENNTFKDVYLEGAVKIICEGNLYLDEIISG